MKTTLKVGVAVAAAAFSIIPAGTATPAAAAPLAQPASAAHAEGSTHASTAARASWHTQRHEALGPLRSQDTGIWKRPSGVRIMQVKARCWDQSRKGARLNITLIYRRRWGNGDGVAKEARGACNGQYIYARIHNAGHEKYYASFSVNKRHTVEYWVQYYK
ncbi:hypothetical protein Skr01_29760 [Sphaerisporangium krabiense]|uniref:Uncharacterized protein n=1 Tax=Sphaerisporangium krabiense TaxID=763782 RepID=A0A7W8Z1K0_9ACTN|nr:hypothetical protein [Sphaerisporangium krabiense]MBB5625773.1 hypothetical protein [Sphaerisporangium krabiense]GII62891.1 hypothetical protein Skr01_29760 [Sphaerisporangium krabiense]